MFSDKLVSVITERPCILRSADVDTGFPIPGGLDDKQPWLTRSSTMFTHPDAIGKLRGVSSQLDSGLMVISQLCVITEHILDALYTTSRSTVVRSDARDDRFHKDVGKGSGDGRVHDQGAALASRWFSDASALWGLSSDANSQKTLPEKFLRLMHMLTLWTEYMPGPMRGTRMPLT